MKLVRRTLIVTFSLCIFAMPAFAQRDIVSYLKGNWGMSADCTPTTAVITYDFNSAGSLVGTQQVPTDPKLPHLKRTYTKTFMSGANTAMLISTVTDVKTAKDIGILESEIELDDEKYRVINQKGNGKPLIISGKVIASGGKPSVWIYKCSSQVETAANSPLYYPVPKTPEDNKEKVCQNNKMLQRAGRSTQQERVQTDDDFTFTPEFPSKTFSAIASVEVRESLLIITFDQKSLYEEMKGKVVKTIEKTVYDASPGTAIIGHTLTLGLGLLTNPGKSLQHAFGCTDEEVLKKEVEVAKSVPTGQFSIKDSAAKHKVQLTGLGNTQTFDVVSSSEQNPQRVSIDLLPIILNSSVTNITNLTVSCLTCNTQGIDKRVSLASSNTTASLSYDFRPLKEQQFEAERKKNEEASRFADEQRKREIAGQERQRKAKEAEIAQQKRLDQEILDQRRKLEQEEIRRKQQREKQEQIFKL